MGGVRVTRCFCNSCGGRATHHSHGLLLGGGRLHGLRHASSRPNFAVIPAHVCVGRQKLTGIIVTLTGNGGRCSGHRALGRGRSEQVVSHVFGHWVGWNTQGLYEREQCGG